MPKELNRPPIRKPLSWKLVNLVVPIDENFSVVSIKLGGAMKLRFGVYFGFFVVLFCGGLILVQYFGEPGKLIPFSVAVLFVVLGLDLVFLTLRRYLRKKG